ncbi:ubiquitin-conjugating enzyme E2-24 kDa-like [Teleopsis dalmanni]|uniref:ubiquitin-conjugating enzyme E2-24 kDa-like n=1 Tax=Teleopsis dalmanni TaxID=139649 RepID=UPI0018CD2D48|nr:ubiquitin-conjugating enzyme E2-24 kDa-like [Teleopsis dalmanni]
MENFTNKRRVDNDIMQLVQYNPDVNIINIHELEVKFRGPCDSLYENGVWKVRVIIPRNYPYEAPTVIFKNRIMHPNIKEQSGAICMNVLYEAWTPLYTLRTIFEMFLPELLRDPNVNDPLNLNAASLYKTNKEQYDARVRQYVIRYATEQQVITCNGSESDSELSDNSSSDIELPRVSTGGASENQANAENITQSTEMEVQNTTGNIHSLASNVDGDVYVGGSVPLQSSSLIEETTNDVFTAVESVMSMVEDVNGLLQLEDILELDENINDNELLVSLENVEQIAGEVASMQAVINAVQLEDIPEEDEHGSDDSEQEFISVIEVDEDQLETDEETAIDDPVGDNERLDPHN